MLGKLFGRSNRRLCPICGRAVADQAVRCDGCGRTIGMPRTLRHVSRDKVKVVPIRPADSGRDED